MKLLSTIGMWLIMGIMLYGLWYAQGWSGVITAVMAITMGAGLFGLLTYRIKERK